MLLLPGHIGMISDDPDNSDPGGSSPQQAAHCRDHNVRRKAIDSPATALYRPLRLRMVLRMIDGMLRTIWRGAWRNRSQRIVATVAKET
jgi:hypothetical protein